MQRPAWLADAATHRNVGWLPLTDLPWISLIYTAAEVPAAWAGMRVWALNPKLLLLVSNC